MKNQQDYDLVIKRLNRLEKYVFRNKDEQTLEDKKDRKSDFSGPTGGLRFLVLRNFFKTKRKFSDIRAELEKNSYHYSPQAVDMGLKRLSKLKGPLVALKQKGKKFYGERK
ncbi:MAG: hypothetical protein WC705_03065 [Candidatus Paceibacterota bacterium]|jgi:hypothetical protein